MREPVVAGRFYPDDADELRKIIGGYLGDTQHRSPLPAAAVIAPHAGYIYSGKVATQTLGAVNIPETVMLLGPNHTGKGSSAALSTQPWLTPLGVVPANTELANLILQNSEIITADEIAHRFEHSLEVQLPILQKLQPHLSLIALTLSNQSYDSCEEIAESLYQSVMQYKGKTLIVASTDMNHYEARSVSNAKDKLALQAIEAMDPQALYATVKKNKISMCGVIPVVITLLICLKMGADSADISAYMDSGDVSGDTGQVVGYAGVIIR
ncbi:AmmeMemoRadiSam system protein B [Desulforhopalus sp. IMCC35007]|uniref:AmmeMemoRadiSam system protein B n=1 Tax=Desulforhopalus sp. IMCC35007 TaxID=2569543 RepID=UPI0010ADFB46|nr:AmmeMemoRadiSam system protein B [Desulforhopalus sp. IMCC35007]TKB09395.1 AmmeMemoRadiSam system protein B [Desulforhopalus sp. IMCC35007]